MTPGQQLAAVFQQELDALRQLNNILNCEHQALLDAAAEELEQATQDKHRALDRQAQTFRLRQQLLGQCGAEASPAGMEQLIDACENPAALRATRDELDMLARQCQELNRSNGRLISQRQQQTRGALDILRQTDGAPGTYSEAGDAVERQANRLLGKA